MKILLVGGTFGDIPKESSVIKMISEEISKREHRLHVVNGGKFQILKVLLQDAVLAPYDATLWFPNISNDFAKLRAVKSVCPHTLLVTSKRNNGEYPFGELVNRALQLKSNLVIEFKKEGNKFSGMLFDPLGCVWAERTTDLASITQVMLNRLEFLQTITRSRSVELGGTVNIPDEVEFFDVVRQRADTFHSLIHPSAGVTRFLGNASFRCERGFPAFKHGPSMFVSRRNIDKRYIDKDAFVRVAISGNDVMYHGNFKPSVDAAIQVRVFQYYKNVKYIIHSHVYVKGSPFTKNALPCGAIEEFDEIIHTSPDKTKTCFSLNLIGHGSIVLADNVDYFNTIEYYAREIPEIIHQ